MNNFFLNISLFRFSENNLFNVNLNEFLFSFSNISQYFVRKIIKKKSFVYIYNLLANIWPWEWMSGKFRCADRYTCILSVSFLINYVEVKFSLCFARENSKMFYGFFKRFHKMCLSEKQFYVQIFTRIINMGQHNVKRCWKGRVSVIKWDLLYHTEL